MAKTSTKTTKVDDNYVRTRPAITPEGRETQLIAKAINLAEKQLDEGTASAQVITHFLKLGTETARLEREKLERENILLAAKAEALESNKRSEELFERALKAMSDYQGAGSIDKYDDSERY